MSNTIVTITPAEAPQLILDVMLPGHVPMVTSSPGVGKSSIAKQIARTHNLKLIDIRLSMCDPTDLNGFPAISEDKMSASYVPMDTFPISTDSLPKHKDEHGQDMPDNIDANGKDLNSYSGWLMLLDEFNSAPISVQAAAYKIVLDKEVGQHRLHPKVAIMCAGNLDTDKAIVNRLSTAMQSRLIHLQLDVSHKDWMTWAHANKIDYRVISFLNYKKELLHAFDPTHSDKTFPCPRTWEFLSDIIKPFKHIDNTKAPLISGTIGEGPGMEFTVFCAIFDNLPKLADIIKNPLGTNLPDDPAVNYAITGMLSNNLTTSNAGPIMPFIDRMGVEFQIITLRGAIKNDPTLADIPAVDKWVTKNAQHLV